jgi:hypothetical protein
MADQKGKKSKSILHSGGKRYETEETSLGTIMVKVQCNNESEAMSLAFKKVHKMQQSGYEMDGKIKVVQPAIYAVPIYRWNTKILGEVK